MENKTHTLSDVKVLDSAQGIVEAFVNSMGEIDADGDVIDPSAFDNSILMNMPVSVLSGHDSSKIIGKVLNAHSVQAGDGTARLYNRIQFNLDTQIGREAFSNVSGGYVDQWSVGFNIPDGGAELIQQGSTAVRLIKDVDWVEVSSVIRGASPNTTTISAKADVEKVDTPSFMKTNIRKGLEYYEEGLAGSGLTSQTVREARQMSGGIITENKIIRMNAWFARHKSDLDSSANSNSRDEDFPAAGAVAWYLWGGDPLNPSQAMNWAERQAERVREGKAAIPYRATATTDSAWNGPRTVAAIPTDASRTTLRQMFAYVDSDENPTSKSSYKFPHHVWDGGVGDANIRACRAGIAALNGARGGTDIPESDRAGVYRHLRRHLDEAGIDAPELLGAESAEEEMGRRRRRRNYQDEAASIKEVTDHDDNLAADDDVVLVTESFVPSTDEQRQQVQAKLTELRARQLGIRLLNISE